MNFNGEYAEVDTIEEWYEKYHPNLSFGVPVPNKCIDCYKELKIGDVVSKRFGSGSNWGFETSGEIAKIYTSGDDTIYEVEYFHNDEKRTVLLARVELIKA